ncbi:unnamed protein product, partial [Protopolystoma xenopodis]
DKLRLVGEVHYPNLEFDTTNIAFGHILNHTEITRQTLITNCSPLPVRYRWSLLVGEGANIFFRREAELPGLLETVQRIETPASILDEDPTEAEPTSRCIEQPDAGELDTYKDVTEEKGGPACAVMNPVLRRLLDQDRQIVPLSIEEVFDITPLYGQLAPGESQPVLFTFFGHADIEACVTAACQVDDGPVYRVVMSGQASSSNYVLEPSSEQIEFGRIVCHETASGHLRLYNTGQVAFTFRVFVEAASLADAHVVVEPDNGQLEGQTDVELCLKVVAYLPKKFIVNLRLEVGHFSPQRIFVSGEGDFASLLFTLPRAGGSAASAEEAVKGRQIKHGGMDFMSDGAIHSAFQQILRTLKAEKSAAQNMPCKSLVLEDKIEIQHLQDPEMDLEHEAERRFICEYLNLLKPLKPEVDVATATHILLTGNPDFAGLSR